MFKSIVLFGFSLLLSSALSAATDPTRPFGLGVGAEPASGQESQSAQTAALKLESIRRLGNYYSAMINGRHLHPGEQVGDARIVRIDASGVTLERASGQERLQLRRAFNKSQRQINKRD